MKLSTLIFTSVCSSTHDAVELVGRNAAVEERELVGVLGQTTMSEIGHDLLRFAVMLVFAPSRW